MRYPRLLGAFAAASLTSLGWQSSTASANGTLCVPTIDSSKFASVQEVEHLVAQVCKGGLRLPGSKQHLAAVSFIKCQLRGMPGLSVTESHFEIDGWIPANNSLYSAGGLKIDGHAVDIASAIGYALPTNGSYVSGKLLYVPAGTSLANIDIKGRIIVRDYTLLNIPAAFLSLGSFYVAPGSLENLSKGYTRPFLTPPGEDLKIASLKGAAGFISAFNISRAQIEDYYSNHIGIHWLVPGVYTGAEQYLQVKQAALDGKMASIKVDATVGRTKVPTLTATLPGLTNNTIVVATHTDGDTYVQENGPAALLTLARYLASLPLSSRNATIRFEFQASHLAYQKDSDRTVANAIDAGYDSSNATVSYVIAIEHLGTRAVEQKPAANGTYGNVLDYTGNGEPLLMAVGPVQPAIDSVVRVAKARQLDNMFVSPGFPPANASQVPTYYSFGGIGSYYHDALVPTIGIISGPWSLWAPKFGAAALNYTRLRDEHIAIGDIILSLSQYSKAELAGNYTEYRQKRAAGVPTSDINTKSTSQYISPELEL